MKISILLFSLLVGICLALGIVLMTEEPEGAAGVAHPEFSSMLRGGDGAQRLAPVRLVSRALGVLLILFFVGLLALGARSKKSFPTERRVLWIGALVYAALDRRRLREKEAEKSPPASPRRGGEPWLGF